MKKSVLLLLVSAACLAQSGCLVYSLFPWLTDATRVAEPMLSGAWYDAVEHSTLFLKAQGQGRYTLLLVNPDAEQFRLDASLHRLDKALLLMVGPENPDKLGVCLLPGYMLLRLELADDVLKMFSLDPDAFAVRLKGTDLQGVKRGGDVDLLLISSSEKIEAFLRKQLADPALFGSKPAFSYKRLFNQ